MEINNLPKAILNRYARINNNGTKETWPYIVKRCVDGVGYLDSLNNSPVIDGDTLNMMKEYMFNNLAHPSGRWLWVGGTEWIKKPQNYPGAYNCSSTHFKDLECFRDLAEVCLCGCGIGFVLSEKNISQLPMVNTKLNVEVVGKIGVYPPGKRLQSTYIETGYDDTPDKMYVGDSRKGWVDAYYELIKTAFSGRLSFYGKREISIKVNLSNLRPKGERIAGFGGVANPDYLSTMFVNIAAHLNGAFNRRLNSVEITKILGEIALAVELGAIRRSASIAQFDEDDEISKDAKLNLWKQDEDNNWSINPQDLCLTMANHTRVFFRKPSLQEIKDAVTKQYRTGEGAIMYAPEAIARCNADILPHNSNAKSEFLTRYCSSPINAAYTLKDIALTQNIHLTDEEINYRLNLYGINPCGEIPMGDNLCNLSEVPVGLLNPFDLTQQKKAFTTSSLFAAALLNHRFIKHERYQRGREVDPIVGVSITGVFDFFMRLFNDDYLSWIYAKREPSWNEAEDLDKIDFISKKLNLPNTVTHGEFYIQAEAFYYKLWRKYVEEVVADYCNRAGLKKPNRATTIQPSGTKSLLTNSSPGIHPTWGPYFIRRVKLMATDPIAKALIKAGHTVVRSQADIAKDTNEEVVIEFPVKANWVDSLKSYDDKSFAGWPALAMFRFCMNAQVNYVGHNTSCTVNLAEDEIEEVSNEIFKAIKEDEGYVSVAMLPKSDIPYPNLPFENITKERYEEMASRISPVNLANAKWEFEESPAACEGMSCGV
jgi:ribonucleoside-triphosphate reductase, adenosylcobalamin-dependent